MRGLRAETDAVNSWADQLDGVVVGGHYAGWVLSVHRRLVQIVKNAFPWMIDRKEIFTRGGDELIGWLCSGGELAGAWEVRRLRSGRRYGDVGYGHDSGSRTARCTHHKPTELAILHDSCGLIAELR